MHATRRTIYANIKTALAEPKSARQLVQEELVAFLTKHADVFDAPYGILPGLQPVGTGGKVRTVTFGRRRVLDAQVCIWAPGLITVHAQGAYASSFPEKYPSVQVLISHLRNTFKIE